MIKKCAKYDVKTAILIAVAFFILMVFISLKKHAKILKLEKGGGGASIVTTPVALPCESQSPCTCHALLVSAYSCRVVKRYHSVLYIFLPNNYCF